MRAYACVHVLRALLLGIEHLCVSGRAHSLADGSFPLLDECVRMYVQGVSRERGESFFLQTNPYSKYAIKKKTLVYKIHEIILAVSAVFELLI